MNNSTVQLLTSLSSLTDEELRNINNLVVSELKHRRDKKNFAVVSQLRIGSTVTFQSKYGLVKGTVEKINAKTVNVKSNLGVNWKVSPTLLKVV